MAFRYLVSYLEREPDRPRGLGMWQREGDRLDMLAWDWIELRWRGAPDLVAPMLFGDVAPRTREVTRAEAEQIAADLGISALPSEQEAMEFRG